MNKKADSGQPCQTPLESSKMERWSAAENLFSSPPRPQTQRFESLSLKTPQTVPPTPGTALQNKMESRLEKSLGSTFNIQLKQEMGVFQASINQSISCPSA